MTADEGSRPSRAFLAAELRRARGAAGLSQSQLAEAITYSESLVAMVETGRRTPSKDFTSRCDDRLNTGGLLTRILTDLVSLEYSPECFRPWIPLEQEATALHAYESQLVPGLLQTADYARAVLRSIPPTSDEELDQRVAARLERQQILHRKRPPLFISIIDEMVLRRPIGGTPVMHAQLLHLAEMDDRDLVRLQVVPQDVGMYAGLNGAFTLAAFGDDGEMVYLDGPVRGQVAESPADVAIIRRAWEELRCDALPRTRSIELIREVAESWKS